MEWEVCCGHGVKIKSCDHKGCTNQFKWIVCVRHGAKKKLFSQEGCISQVIKEWDCIRYGTGVLNIAATMVAPTLSRQEEFVLPMAQRKPAAATRNVPTSSLFKKILWGPKRNISLSLASCKPTQPIAIAEEEINMTYVMISMSRVDNVAVVSMP